MRASRKGWVEGGRNTLAGSTFYSVILTMEGPRRTLTGLRHEFQPCRTFVFQPCRQPTCHTRGIHIYSIFNTSHCTYLAASSSKNCTSCCFAIRHKFHSMMLRMLRPCMQLLAFLAFATHCIGENGLLCFSTTTHPLYLFLPQFTP